MHTAKSGSHSIWDCKYHIVWVTKYRYPVLVGDVGLRTRELLREISRSHEMSIHAGAINRDHVHLLLSIPPHLSAVECSQDKTPCDLGKEAQQSFNDVRWSSAESAFGRNPKSRYELGRRL